MTYSFFLDYFNYFSFVLRVYLLHTILFICICCTVLGQVGIMSNPDWLVKPTINKGFVLIHRSAIANLIKGYPTIYELNISKPTLGNKLWHLENNKPDIGISLNCIDFKNAAQLGYAFTIAPYIEIPLSDKVDKNRLVMRLCWGATYVTKHFDISNNRKNTAIGSHINSFVQFKWFWHFNLTKHLRFEPGFSFSHTSNGKSRNPNLGLNVVSLNAGFNFLIPSKKIKPEILAIDSSTKVKSKNELLVLTAVGFNQREIATDDLKVFLFSTAYQRNIRNTHKYSIGIDFFYDQNYFIDYENSFLKAPNGIDKVRASMRLGYSYNVGRISFPVEIGCYVLGKAKPDGYIVSRIGVRYYFAKGIVAHFGLRTHYAIAYNFEYGLGYRFLLNK